MNLTTKISLIEKDISFIKSSMEEIRQSIDSLDSKIDKLESFKNKIYGALILSNLLFAIAMNYFLWVDPDQSGWGLERLISL